MSIGFWLQENWEATPARNETQHPDTSDFIYGQTQPTQRPSRHIYRHKLALLRKLHNFKTQQWKDDNSEEQNICNRFTFLHFSWHNNRIAIVSTFFAQNLALYNKNNRVLLSQALCVKGYLKNLMVKLHISPRTLIFAWTSNFLGRPITR